MNVNLLLRDLHVAEHKWHCPAWEVSGRPPGIWRAIYLYLDALLSEVRARFDRDEANKNGGSSSGGKPMFKKRKNY